jgi:hypothetical protein
MPIVTTDVEAVSASIGWKVHSGAESQDATEASNARQRRSGCLIEKPAHRSNTAKRHHVRGSHQGDFGDSIGEQASEEQENDLNDCE